MIARARSITSSDLGELTWEWVLRAVGHISYRLTEIAGRWEQNPWQPVTRLHATPLQTGQP